MLGSNTGFNALPVYETLLNRQGRAADSTNYFVGSKRTKGFTKFSRPKSSEETGNGNVIAFFGKSESAKDSYEELPSYLLVVPFENLSQNASKGDKEVYAHSRKQRQLLLKRKKNFAQI